MKLDLSGSEVVRAALTEEQERAIAQMYLDLSRQAHAEAERLKLYGTNTSAAMRAIQLEELARQLSAQHAAAMGRLNGQLQGAVGTMAGAVGNDMAGWLQSVGLAPISGAYSHVPAQAIEAIISGALYKGDWSLSDALWQNNQAVRDDIYRVIAEGMALNRTTYDIAKDLEKYLNPHARKDWDWGKVYPGTRLKVDYSAQRLARTMIAHAYQYALVETCRNNPFVVGFIWHSVLQERTCDLCEERDGQFYGKNELPLDHPNGLCWWEAYMPDDLTAIGERLGDWVNGGSDPALDGFAAALFGTTPHRDSQGRFFMHTNERIANSISLPALTTINRRGMTQLTSHARQLLLDVKGYEPGTEFAKLIPLDNMARVTTIKGGIGYVDIGQGLNEPYAMLHNHGSGLLFSLADLYNFAINKNMRVIGAIGNGGQVYLAEKVTQIDIRAVRDVVAGYEKAFRGANGINRIRIIQKLCEELTEYGIRTIGT